MLQLYFIRPGARLARTLERRTLGIDLAQILPQFLGQAVYDVGMLGCHVVLLADVFGNVEQLLLAGLVVIYQLPLVLADGTVEVDARSVIAPDVGEVPHQRTAFRGVARTFQQRHEADAVQRSYRLVIFHTGHLEQRRIEILNHQILIATRVGVHYARPAHNHRLADAALVERTLAAAQRRILRMHFAVAPLGLRLH